MCVVYGIFSRVGGAYASEESLCSFRGFVGAPHALSPEAAEEVFDVLATEACADAEKRA